MPSHNNYPTDKTYNLEDPGAWEEETNFQSSGGSSSLPGESCSAGIQDPVKIACVLHLVYKGQLHFDDNYEFA
ncbi:hypothetical protein J6590_093425 [Homalodisca vitripennis]|nr:hypothetical protein J6590_089773 [Homalodisca vitripennis]KAG8294859.1 hypothetical protein J6590_093425 [Homalodisca vitripennis]